MDIRGSKWYQAIIGHIFRSATDMMKDRDIDYIEIRIAFSRRSKTTIKVSYPTHLGQKSAVIHTGERDD